MNSTDPFHGAHVDKKYKILEKISSTEIAVIYRAENTIMGTLVDFKVLHPDFDDEVQVDTFLERFEEEAIKVSKIDHPNVMPIFDSGVFERHAYLVTQINQGRSLRDILNQQSPFSLERALDLIDQVASGLFVAHSQNILHLDLKPMSVQISKIDGVETAQIINFGIAHAFFGKNSNLAVMTKTGKTVGTPQYMSPELFRGGQADARCDIYSLGVLLYELITGRVPFDSESAMDILEKHLHEEPPPFSQLELPQEVPHRVESVVRKALAKDPDERQQTVWKFLDEIREAVDSPEREERAEEIVPHASLGASLANHRRRRRKKKRFPDIELKMAAGVGVLAVILLVFMVLTSKMQREKIDKRRPIVVANTKRDISVKELVNIRNEKRKKRLAGEVVPVPTAEPKVNLLPEEDLPAVEIEKLGIRIKPLNRSMAEKYGLKSQGGLFIENVQEKSLAEKSKIKPGDIVHRVDTTGESILTWQPKPVKSIEEFQTALSAAMESKNRLGLVVKRGNYEGLLLFVEFKK